MEEEDPGPFAVHYTVLRLDGSRFSCAPIRNLRTRQSAEDMANRLRGEANVVEAHVSTDSCG